MKLLAIDPGSNAIGFAYFVDGDLTATELIRPRTALTWLERMGYIADELARGARTRGWIPDVVAIEDVVMHRDPRGAITMGMTRGYLARVVDELYPRCRWIEISKAATCRAVGVKGNARREQRQAAGRERFPQLESQDVVDAAVVGIAAIAAIGEHMAAST